MSNPDQSLPQKGSEAAEPSEPESMALDKETLKDLDASGEAKGAFGVDWTKIYTTECISKDCYTTIRV